MMAVQAKGEAEEKGLMGVVGEAVIWEVGDFVCLEAKDGERLLFAGGVRAVAAVKEYCEFSIGGKDGRCWEIINRAGFTRNFAEDSAIGQVDERLLRLKSGA